MHLLVAALLGAGLGLAAYLITAKVTGSPITWRRALAAAAGGAVGGLVLTATLGVGGAAAATSLRITGATFASGAASGGVEQAARNGLEGRPIGERVVTSAAVAGGAAVAFRGLGTVLVKPAEAVSARIPRVLSAEENPGILGSLSRLGPVGVVGDLARRTGRKLTEKIAKDSLDVNDPPPHQ